MDILKPKILIINTLYHFEKKKLPILIPELNVLILTIMDEILL